MDHSEPDTKSPSGSLKGTWIAIATGFGAGCLLLIFMFGISGAEWWRSVIGEYQGEVTRILAVGLGLVIAILLVEAWQAWNYFQRWAAVALSAVLILGFSALAFFSFGFFSAPVGIALLLFALAKLTIRPGRSG